MYKTIYLVVAALLLASHTQAAEDRLWTIYNVVNALREPYNGLAV